MHTFITSRVDHCNGVLYGSNGYLLDRLQSVLNSAARLILGFLSSTAFLLPSAMNSTGCRLGNASGSKSLSSCDIVSLVRHLSIWRNSVVRWVRPLVGSVYALPHVVISLFRDSDFKGLATGLLLSLGPMCGTLSRPKLDNRVTIYYSSRVNWKHFCSSSPEPFCGSISNEGPYNYSILLLRWLKWTLTYQTWLLGVIMEWQTYQETKLNYKKRGNWEICRWEGYLIHFVAHSLNLVVCNSMKSNLLMERCLEQFKNLQNKPRSETIKWVLRHFLCLF